MTVMLEKTENKRLMSHAEIKACLERINARLRAAREDGERARMLREQREEFERQYFGRRFILIRF
jgi:hypothetical protein